MFDESRCILMSNRCIYKHKSETHYRSASKPSSKYMVIYNSVHMSAFSCTTFIHILHLTISKCSFFGTLRDSNVQGSNEVFFSAVNLIVVYMIVCLAAVYSHTRQNALNLNVEDDNE